MDGKMEALTGAVDGLVNMEYMRAGAIHGLTFQSGHEGYGIIAEEVQEARECMERIEAVMYQLLKSLRLEDDRATCDLSKYILDSAIQGAAELVQVGAMCRKMIRTLKEGSDASALQA